MAYTSIPKTFRRNEVANLCRRKGYALQRYYDTFYKLWFHRTVPIRWLRGTRSGQRSGLDYCPTDSHTPLQRIWAHMQGKRDLRIVKP